MADTAPDPAKPAPMSGFSRWVPSLPTNLVASMNPFANDPAGAAKETGSPSPPVAFKRQSVFASIFAAPVPNGPSTTSLPESHNDDNASAMFSEPDTHSTSDMSREGSVDGSIRPSNKKSNRPKTCYSVCHPPPASTARQRLHRRPRSLLQLHKLSPSARPQPAFEVVPTANFSVRLTKAITKLYKAKHSLCPSDLVVLRAEKYVGREDDVEQQVHDIVALICKGKKEDGCVGPARICLPDGREWDAYATSNGGYEFSTIDEHGLGVTARWVPKKNCRTREGEVRRFNFSTISPNSRRHPVIATLSRSGLDINDSYKMPEAAGATPLNTPKQTSTILEDAMLEETEGAVDHQLHVTDERLRQIIVMTGLWVLYKEGWSPNFRYDDKDAAAAVPLTPRSPSIQRSPSKSGPFYTSSTPPASPGLAPLEKRSSIKSISSSILPRRQSLLSRSNRASAASTTEVAAAAPGTTTDGHFTTETVLKSRSRANSQSTVLVHRAASNRRKQATWRPDLLAASVAAAQEPSTVPEASIEDSGLHSKDEDESEVSEVEPEPEPQHHYAPAPRHSDLHDVSPTRRLSVPAPAPAAAVPRGRSPTSATVTAASRAEARQSNATSTTTTSASDGSGAAAGSRKSAQAKKKNAANGGDAKPLPPPAKKKRAAWRRLLCGSGGSGSS